MCGDFGHEIHKYTRVSEVKEEIAMATGDTGDYSSRSGAVVPSDVYQDCRYVVTRIRTKGMCNKCVGMCNKNPAKMAAEIDFCRG